MDLLLQLQTSRKISGVLLFFHLDEHKDKENYSYYPHKENIECLYHLSD